jgi:hypothetical protein
MRPDVLTLKRSIALMLVVDHSNAVRHLVHYLEAALT